jgi:hypothetical protein
MNTSPSESMVEQRRKFSGMFFGVLIGIAFREAVAPIREDFRAAAGPATITITILMGLVFFLTAMRFLFGNELHLSRISNDPNGWIWFMDFMIVAFEGFILISLGGICSNTHINQFFYLLSFLYALDVAWIAGVQALLGRFVPSLRRGSIPWRWAWINLAALVCMLIFWLISYINGYKDWVYVAILFTINLFAFYKDVAENLLEFQGEDRGSRPSPVS